MSSSTSETVGLVAPAPPAPTQPSRARNWVRENRTSIALPTIMLVVAVIGALTTPSFLTYDNVDAILRNTAVVGIGAVGLAFVTASGNFISLGSQQQAMLCAMVLAATLSSGWNVVAAVALVVIVGLAVGFVQGVCVAMGLNSVIATLAVGAIIYGGVQAVAGGRTITFDADGFSWLASGDLLGVPTSVVLLLVVTAFGNLVVRRTTVGRRLILTGGSAPAARLAGISTERISIFAFLWLGAALALCGILSAAQVGSASGVMFSTLTFDVATAVVVGSIAITGGEGSPLRAVTGALFISMMNSVMILHGFSPGARQLVSGVVLVLAIIVVHLLRGREDAP